MAAPQPVMYIPPLEEMLNSISKKKQFSSLKDKKGKMVSFLFETILGLYIAQSMNVSSNRSYQCFNGRFKS